jgi:phosphatidylglycerol:prolipoprotein diacylglycerol transferase
MERLVRPFLVAFLDRLLSPGWGETLAPTYVIMLCLAMISGALLALRLGRESGFDMRRGMGALLGAWVGALIGGRLLTMIVNMPDAYAAGDSSLMTLRGGFAAYGGFLGGAAGGWIALGRRDFLRFADLMAPGLGLGTALTRVGCFLAGCDFGTPTALPWAVRFPPESPAFHAHLQAGWVGAYSPSSLPVHPTELYESLLGLVICGVALVALHLGRNAPAKGHAFLTAAGLYAVGRFGIEALRGDADRGLAFVLSTSQIVSIVLLLWIGGYLIWRHQQKGPAQAAG